MKIQDQFSQWQWSEESVDNSLYHRLIHLQILRLEDFKKFWHTHTRPMLQPVRSTSTLAHVTNRSWFRGKSHPMITNMKAFLSLLFWSPRPLFIMSHSFTRIMVKVACSYSLVQEINSGSKYSLQLRSVAAWLLSLSFLCLLPSTSFVRSIAELKSTGQLTAKDWQTIFTPTWVKYGIRS